MTVCVRDSSLVGTSVLKVSLKVSNLKFHNVVIKKWSVCRVGLELGLVLKKEIGLG